MPLIYKRLLTITQLLPVRWMDVADISQLCQIFDDIAKFTEVMPAQKHLRIIIRIKKPIQVDNYLNEEQKRKAKAPRI
jgi:hypothetical protein